METENGKRNRTSMRGAIYTEWVREGHKCEKKNVQKVENLIFKNDAKKFYREIGKEKVTVNETTAINDIERLGDRLWSEERL